MSFMGKRIRLKTNVNGEEGKALRSSPPLGKGSVPRGRVCPVEWCVQLGKWQPGAITFPVPSLSRSQRETAPSQRCRAQLFC